LTDWNAGSPLLLESYHVERLQTAAKKFGWEAAIRATKSPDFAAVFRATCKEAVNKFEGDEQVVLIRITLSYEGTLNYATLPGSVYQYDIFAMASWSPEKGNSGHSDLVYTVYLDNKPTTPSDFTSYKTTRREHYNAARDRAGIKSRNENKEVILVNDEGQIMEGSVTCVGFWRNGTWIMPPLSAGGLAGVDRRWLLEQGKIKEEIILKDDLKEGEYVLLTNGWIGAQLGKLRLSISTP